MTWKDFPCLAKLYGKALSETPSPQLKSPLEALVVALHTLMTVLGFELTALWEDQTKEHPKASESSHLLAPGWNPPNATLYILSYSLQRAQGATDRKEYVRLKIIHVSSAESVVTCTREGAIVDAEEVEVEAETASVNVKYNSWFKKDSFPFALSYPKESADQSAEFVEKQVSSIFVSSSKFSELAELFKEGVLNKIFPHLEVPKGRPDSSDDKDGSASTRPSVPKRDPKLNPNPPYRPPHRERTGEERTIPGFDDEFELLPKSAGQRLHVPSAINPQPPSLGSRDLNPPGFGSNDPLRRIHDPYSPDGQPGGGMHPTFDDPIFNPPGGGDGSVPGGSASGAHPFNAPPGARFDPPGPFGTPQDSRPMRFPGRGGGGGPGGPPGFPGGFSGGFF